ncbi:MAG: Fe-Mn family superoxide dismutase [Pseudomonadota bacterium]|nr:Fe-Mn family superoxide dismutase [Pseudomonadota bacterium]
MSFELPPLPYAEDALEPHISSETIQYHYGKHHAAYVSKLNAAVEADSALQVKTLEEIIRSTSGGVFNNAAQVWNHTFYWNGLSPEGGGEPTGALAKAIDEAFGSFNQFKEKFTTAGGGNFGSGWTWLVKKADGSIDIVNTDDAETPITDESVTALLTMDVWEHAYYIDYRNARPDYMNSFFKLVNWSFVEENFNA